MLKKRSHDLPNQLHLCSFGGGRKGEGRGVILLFGRRGEGRGGWGDGFGGRVLQRGLWLAQSARFLSVKYSPFTDSRTFLRPPHFLSKVNQLAGIGAAEYFAISRHCTPHFVPRKKNPIQF